ncbi:MAG: hypothetical protein AB1921_10355 [Thermodesulfobacteriota bacterium]
MKKLGIRIDHDTRENEDVLSPGYPLLALCYSRFGFIRLSKGPGKGRK